MAGSYPDVPSWRIPYDQDGTILLGNGAQQPGSSLQTLNSESYGGILGVGYTEGMTWVLLFPRKIDLRGTWITHYKYGSYGGFGGMAYSTNTTNGTDGTWTGFSAPYGGAYRSVTAQSIDGINAIRGSHSGATGVTSLNGVHLYGTYAATEDTNYLEIWHPTLDQRIPPAFFDFGDIPRGTTSERQFRVKNMSDTLTANTITVSINSLTDGSPSFAGMHTLSSGGGFASTVSISSLAPAAVSGVLTLRQAVPPGAQLSLWASRIRAQPATWT